MWNAVLYLTRNGCTWRVLPHDFPPWPVVWGHFRCWRDNGTLKRVHAALRTEVRTRAGRAATPSLVVVDSQPARTTETGGPEASTPARRSRGASATAPSTRSA